MTPSSTSMYSESLNYLHLCLGWSLLTGNGGWLQNEIYPYKNGVEVGEERGISHAEGGGGHTR